MSAQQISLLALAALLVFWVLGAHNRLVALRNAIGAAWTLVDDALQRRAAVLSALLDALPAPPALAETRDAALAALSGARRAAEALRLRPAQTAGAAALADAESALSATLAALWSHAPTDDHGQLLTPAALEEAQQRVDFARRLFNDAVAVYNAAARQFPTRFVAQLFGFGEAGAL